MKNSPSLKVVFDRRKRSGKTGKGTVEIVVSYAGSRKWISTGIQCAPDNWKGEKGVVNSPDAFLSNQTIFGLKKRITDYILRSIADGEVFSFEGLDSHLHKSDYSGSFITFMEEYIEERSDIKPRTKINHRNALSMLEKFGKIHSFGDLTRRNILDFDQFMHSRDLKQSTVHSYHKIVKAYIHLAIAREMVDSDPYFDMRIESGRSNVPKFLTEREIGLMRDCKILPAALDKVRDMFMFQFYTGLSHNDMNKFDYRKVVERDGKHVLVDRRQKTDTEFYIVLLSPAMDILRKYDFELPQMTNQQYNSRLKAVADCSGIEKKVTSHMARHSYAVHALNSGVPIEVVSKTMGHTNISTTQIYAKVLDKTVENAFDMLESKIKSPDRTPPR